MTNITTNIHLNHEALNTLLEDGDEALDVDAKLLEVDHADAVSGLFTLFYVAKLVRSGEL